jgi:hypothetical protein
METALLGKRAKHKTLPSEYIIEGIVRDTVLLKDRYGDNTEHWVPIKGLILQNMWGVYIDPENSIDFTKNAGPRD